MEIVISYSEALEQHPIFVTKWFGYGATLGKRLGIKMNEARIGWSYTFSVKGPSGHNFNPELGVSEDGRETLEEINDEIHSLAKMTPEEIADTVIENVYDIKINAIFEPLFSTKMKTESLENSPTLFIKKCKAIIIDNVKKENDWLAKLNTLTSQEREREESKLFSELFLLKDVASTTKTHKDVTPAPQISFELNDVLDKISKVGMKGLSAEETSFLDEQSRK